MSAQADEIVLRTQGLAKEFHGFVAVAGIDLTIRRGTIHALIGPNGAGKTTVFNLLTKFIAPSAGRIFYGDRDITGASPAQVARMGVVRSFQISAVFPRMSVLENVLVALQRARGGSYDFWRSERILRRFDARARELIAAVGLAGDERVSAAALPYGRKRALEIATTLALDPEMLLLDEPTAGMGHEDVQRVTRLIRDVARGRTVLMVEHNMNVVSGISDIITVMQRGAILAEGRYAEVAANPAVVEAYMGSAHV